MENIDCSRQESVIYKERGNSIHSSLGATGRSELQIPPSGGGANIQLSGGLFQG